MRLLIIGAACAACIIAATISSAYAALSSGPAARNDTAALMPMPTLLPATPAATTVPTTPQPGMWCGELDPGLWKRLPPVDVPPLDGTALPAPQTFSDTMTLLPPGGTVPMPNACLPQQTPLPASTPALRNVVEPVAP